MDLGLFVPDRTVERQGGAVDVDDDPGFGARDSLRFPDVSPIWYGFFHGLGRTVGLMVRSRAWWCTPQRGPAGTVRGARRVKRKRGLLANTIVIFMSDHGEMLGDHHLFRKVTPHEGSAGVPLIIRPPESAGGVRCDAPVTHADIMPTVLELTGLAPAETDGADVSGFLRGESPPWREYVHGEHTGAVGWQFVTNGREKFIWDSMSGREWFFDLANDPQETTDHVADAADAERVSLWRNRLVDTLSIRPQDGLADGKKLTPGKMAPTVRPELLEGVELGSAAKRWD